MGYFVAYDAGTKLSGWHYKKMRDAGGERLQNSILRFDGRGRALRLADFLERFRAEVLVIDGRRIRR